MIFYLVDTNSLTLRYLKLLLPSMGNISFTIPFLGGGENVPDQGYASIAPAAKEARGSANAGVGRNSQICFRISKPFL